MICRRNARASTGLAYRPGDGPESVLIDTLDGGRVLERRDLWGLPKPAQMHAHKRAASFQPGDRPGAVWVTTLSDGIIYAPRPWRGIKVGSPVPDVDHAARAARSMAAKMRARALTRIY